MIAAPKNIVHTHLCNHRGYCGGVVGLKTLLGDSDYKT